MLQFTKKNLLGAAITFTLMVIVATTAQAASVKGVVYDATADEPMAQASVKLLAARDSSFVKGTAADDDGFFQFTDLRPGRYIVQVSYIGFKTLNKDVRLTKEEPDVDLGSIGMVDSGVLLKETTVTGRRAEVKVSEDTIEYAAESYRTQPNAVAEDLIKRLPGVEVGSDGKITAQGKEVTKILIDGKEFFSDDPKVASKNIPVDMIDKVQVVDRKSDLARMTGVDDGEDETVINLTVKKGMNNGWFGNATVGYGTDKRYGANVIANHFWNGNQLTFIGNANNTNNLGFSDGNAERFRRFGGDNGIRESQSIGVNFNVGRGDEFRVGGDLMYSHNTNTTVRSIARQYLFTDSVSYYDELQNAKDRGHNLRGNFRLKWEIDSLNTIDFRPNFTYNSNRSDQAQTSDTYAGDADRTHVNSSENLNRSEGDSFEFSGQLVYNHNFWQQKGRAFSAQLRYRMSNVHEDERAYTLNRFFLLETEEETDQIINNHTWMNNVMSRLTWTEPIGDPAKGNYAQVAYHFNYRWNNADKLVYDHNGTPVLDTQPQFINPLSWEEAREMMSIFGPSILTDRRLQKIVAGDGDELDPELSNSFRNTFFTQRIQLGYKRVSKSLNLDVGVSVNPSMSKSENLTNAAKTIPTRWVWDLAPYLRLRYKFSKQTTLQAFYRGRSQQPSMTQLQPVADVSNPLRIVIGNPDLNPTFTHNAHIRFNDFNVESQRSIMAMLRGQYSRNSIVSRTSYNEETGGQTTTYENVNGVWSLMGFNMISFPFRNKSWQFTNHFFARFNVDKGYINGDFNTSRNFSFNEAPSISYRNDYIEVEARPYYGINTTGNSLPSRAATTVHTFGGNLDVVYNAPFGLSVGTDLTYSDSRGYSQGYNASQWIWNASISYSFLPGRVATIALKAYDLLKQRESISRNVTAAYIQDQEYNTLSRYFMLTFTYKFNSFAGGAIPENKYQDFNRRWGPPGGGPGEHGGPPRR